jgi:hypothetical protein
MLVAFTNEINKTNLTNRTIAVVRACAALPALENTVYYLVL